ncbi:hypothetical protein HDV05_008582 [Chytridiales sp. JEL 0842]|nr:hypothetical protein HDV05_008582 [Chytridiales sp. JEL 0842]
MSSQVIAMTDITYTHQHPASLPASVSKSYSFKGAGFGARELPPDIITTICEAANKEDLLELARVSKAWRTPAERSLWKDVSYTHLQNLVTSSNPYGLNALQEGLGKLVRYGGHVRRLTVRMTKENVFETTSSVGSWVVMNGCSSLQHLKLVRSGSVGPATKLIDNAFTWQLVQQAPRSLTTLTLKSKSLNDETLKSLLLLSTSVKELSLLCPAVTEQGLSEALACAKDRLKALSLSSDCIGKSSMSVISSMPHLETLGLFPKHGVSPDSFSTLLPPSPFPNLKKLAFDSNAHTPDLPLLATWSETLPHLLSNLSKLEEIVVGGSGLLSSRALRSLGEHCGASLRKIQFQEVWTDMDNAGVSSSLKYFKALEIFSMGELVQLEQGKRGGVKVTGALGVGLARWCPRLKFFECGEKGVEEAVREVMRAVREQFGGM